MLAKVIQTLCHRASTTGVVLHAACDELDRILQDRRIADNIVESPRNLQGRSDRITVEVDSDSPR